jgi:hypothetical protein
MYIATTQLVVHSNAMHCSRALLALKLLWARSVVLLQQLLMHIYPHPTWLPNFYNCGCRVETLRCMQQLPLETRRWWRSCWRRGLPWLPLTR